MKKAVIIGIVAIAIIFGVAVSVSSLGSDSENLEIKQPKIQEPKGKVISLQLNDGISIEDTP